MKTWEGLALTLAVIAALILAAFLITGHADLLICGHHSPNGKTC